MDEFELSWTFVGSVYDMNKQLITNNFTSRSVRAFESERDKAINAILFEIRQKLIYSPFNKLYLVGMLEGLDTRTSQAKIIVRDQIDTREE